MSDFAANPYAAPLDPIAVASYAPTPNILRDGKFLIIRDGAILPDICPVTGEAIEPAPGGYRKPRQLTWVPPWVFFGIFAMGLPLLLLIILAQKRGQVTYGLGPVAKSRMGKRKAWTVFFALSSVACVWGAVYYRNAVAPFSIGIAISVLGALIAASITEPIKVISYRKEGWFKLKGCSPAFLDTLPEMPFKALS